MTEQNKYLSGKIYRIVSDYTDDIYIGSTTGTLNKRLSVHKSHYKMYLDGKYCYMTSFEILKYTDAKIELIENFPSPSKKVLELREGYYIKNTPNVVNRCVVGRTRKETYNTYYQNNKEKRLKHASEKIPCECGTPVSRRNIARHKKSSNHTKLIQEIEALKQENEYYKARVQDLIDQVKNDSLVDSEIDTILSSITESTSESESE